MTATSSLAAIHETETVVPVEPVWTRPVGGVGAVVSRTSGVVMSLWISIAPSARL